MFVYLFVYNHIFKLKVTSISKLTPILLFALIRRPQKTFETHFAFEYILTKIKLCLFIKVTNDHIS